MYDFPYQGKSLEECIDLLEADYRENQNLGAMVWGIESLRDSPNDMNAYFDTLTGITEDAVQNDIANGKSTLAVEKVNYGIHVRDVAKELSYGHLRRFIDHYNTEEVHEKWNAALPDLKTAGGFATFF